MLLSNQPEQSPNSAIKTFVEQSMAEMLPYFATMFDSSKDNVAVYDLFGKPVWKSQSTLIALHIDSINEIPESFKKPTHPSYIQYFLAIDNTLKTGQFNECVLMSGHDESDPQVCRLVHISAIRHQNGTLIGALVVARGFDHYELERSRTVEKSEHYLNALLDTFPFMVWMKDKDSRFLKVNAKMAEIAGARDVKAMVGKVDFDFWSDTLAAAYVADDREVLVNNHPKTVVEQIAKSDGQLYWAETYKSPVSINGELIGTVGFARDLTELTSLHSEIAKKELEYRSLVDSLPLSIVRYDLNCKRIYVNAIQNDFAGADPQELKNKTPAEFWSPSIQNMTGEQYQEHIKEVMRTGQPKTFEIEFIKDGLNYINLFRVIAERDKENNIVGALALANDVSEMKHFRGRLEQLAYHDALTSLPNRTLLNERMQQAINDVNKHQTKVGLLFVDLDFFKAINDTLGHAVGDSLLVDAGKRISAAVSETDLVARIGGDEFAILVTKMDDEHDLAALATKIVSVLATPFKIDGFSFFVTASIGISCCPKDANNISDLMKYADTAMYLAKKEGRNNFQFYTTKLTESAMEQLAIATGLRYAIEKNEFSLKYQPIVDMISGEIISAEALIRWHSEVLGNVSPDQFIPIAEETGLIAEIGEWVLLQACKTAAELNQNGISIVVAVNLSSKQFVGNRITQIVKNCLQVTNCKPQWLSFEITERLLLQDNELILEALTEFERMGVSLAIDDFGTGYSALSYMNRFPIHKVKIDRSFVNDICTDEKDALLVKAIIAMGHSLNKELVAEGIETEAQASLLRTFGCGQAQGYFYSRPVSISDLKALIQ